MSLIAQVGIGANSAGAGLGGGIGIVMTDLFISATAALLIVLAISRPTPPVPLPIQADLIVTCPPRGADAAAGFVMRAAAAPDGQAVQVDGPEDLPDAVTAAGLPPALFYTVALVPGAAAPVSAACLQRFTQDVVRAHNKGLADARADPAALMAVFAVGAGAPDHAGLAIPAAPAGTGGN